MAPRETENNAYAKFWRDKQRTLWYVMVFLEWSIRVFPLLSPLLSDHQALYRLSFPLFQEYDEGKQPEIEGDNRLCTSNAAASACLF